MRPDGNRGRRDLRRQPAEMRWTLLAAFCWLRRQEIADGLAELLVQVVHRMGCGPGNGRHRGDQGTPARGGQPRRLFCIAEAALKHPDRTVREILFPLAGKETFNALVQGSNG